MYLLTPGIRIPLVLAWRIYVRRQIFVRAANAAESNFLGCEIEFTNASTILQICFWMFFLRISLMNINMFSQWRILERISNTFNWMGTGMWKVNALTVDSFESWKITDPNVSSIHHSWTFISVVAKKVCSKQQQC